MQATEGGQSRASIPSRFNGGSGLVSADEKPDNTTSHRHETVTVELPGIPAQSANSEHCSCWRGRHQERKGGEIAYKHGLSTRGVPLLPQRVRHLDTAHVRRLRSPETENAQPKKLMAECEAMGKDVKGPAQCPSDNESGYRPNGKTRMTSVELFSICGVVGSLSVEFSR